MVILTFIDDLYRKKKLISGQNRIETDMNKNRMKKLPIWITFLVFIITVLNVFITVFGNFSLTHFVNVNQYQLKMATNNNPKKLLF